MKAFDVVKGFECELALYTGARYCVAVNSCTSAARLAFDWWMQSMGASILEFPSRTYRSMVNMAVKCGAEPVIRDYEWAGQYRIRPSNIWDCALTLRPGMYEKGSVQLLSFHPQKPLALSSGGGAILHDNKEADDFYRLDRFDARREGMGIQGDSWPFYGDHCYMFPGQAGEGLHRLEIFKAANPEGLTMPQPNYENLQEKLEGRQA
jgi:dTDP-4-amino-4,6-dideoxygalactose transaminase